MRFFLFHPLIRFSWHWYTERERSMSKSTWLAGDREQRQAVEGKENARLAKREDNDRFRNYSCVCVYPWQEKRKSVLKARMCNALEGDSAQRLSHHYHQWTDQIKAVHLLLLLFRLTIEKSVLRSYRSIGQILIDRAERVLTCRSDPSAVSVDYRYEHCSNGCCREERNRPEDFASDEESTTAFHWRSSSNTNHHFHRDCCCS